MKEVPSLKCKEKLGLLLSLPEQKQSARQMDIVCSPPQASIPCVAPRRINQKKKEGKRDAGATPCDFLGMWVYFLVQGWYQNGFYFSSKAQTNALWVFLFLFSHSRSSKRGGATSGHLRLNVINMCFCWHRSNEQQLKMAVNQHLAQGRLSVWRMFWSGSLNLQEAAILRCCPVLGCGKKSSWSNID